MKKVLCYIAIVILLIFIILPPILRVFVDDINVDNKPKEVVELLICTLDQEKINMPYINNKLVNIKYTFPINEDDNILSDSLIDNNGDIYGDINENSKIILVGESLKNTLETIPNIKKDSNDGKMTYTLDMNDVNNSSLLPAKYQDSIGNMKTYYTSLGFSCNIMQ